MSDPTEIVLEFEDPLVIELIDDEDGSPTELVLESTEGPAGPVGPMGPEAAVTFSASNGSFAANSVTFANSNGVSFGTGTQGVFASVETAYLPIASSANFAGTDHSHSQYLTTAALSDHGHTQYLTTAALSDHAHSQYLTTAALSDHAHTQYLTAQSGQAFSASGGSSAFQTLEFANSNGVTFSNSGGSLVASVATNYAASDHAHTQYLTTAALSGHSHGISLNLTNLTATTAGNSAGVSLSLSGVAAQTVDTRKAGTGFSSAGLNIGLSGTLNTNGLSLSASVPSQTVQPVAYSAANGSANFSTLTLANSNGVSFSTGTQGLHATVRTDYASSGHSHGDPTLALTNLGGTTASNSAGLTLSLSAAAQTNQQVGLYATSNTTQSSSGTVDARSLSFAGAGNISVGVSNGSVVISATGGGGAGDGFNILAAGTQTAGTAATVNFANSNGITFGMSDNSQITAQHNGLTTAAQSNHSHGVTLNLTNLSGTTGGNSAGVTLSLSAAPQSVQPVAYSAANGSAAFSTLTFANSNGVSFSTGTQGLFATVKTDYLTTAALSNHSHGDPTLALTNLTGTTASNSAGLTLSLSGNAAQTVDTNKAGTGFTSAGNNIGLSGTLGTNGLNLSATVAAQTVQPVAFSAGNGSANFSTLKFADSNGVSFSTGTQGVFATVKTDYLTTAAQSNHSHGNPSLNLTNLSGTTGSNSAGLSLSLSAAAQTVQPVAVSGSNGSFAFSTLTLANSNGVSFGTGTQGIYATVATDHANLTHSHGNPTLALTNLSGTTASNSAGFTLSLAASAVYAATNVYEVGSAGSTGSVLRYAREDHVHAGVVRLYAGSTVGNAVGDSTDGKHGDWVIAVTGNGTMSGITGTNGIHTALISIPNAAASPVGVSAGTQSSNLATINFADSNNLSFGLSNGTITASFNPVNLGVSTGGNTQGNTQVIDGGGAQFVFEGVGLVSLSQSSNGLSNTIRIGASDNVVSTYIPYYPASTGTHTLAAMANTTASAFVYPVSVEHNIRFNEFRALEFFSFVSTTVAASQTISRTLGIYSNNAGTLSLISSASLSYAMSASSVSATLSYPRATGTGGYTYGTTTATATAQAHSLFGTAGNRIVGYQFGNSISLSEGLYWVGVMQRNSSAGAAAGLNCALAGNVMAAAQQAGPIGSYTVSHTNSLNYKFGWGVYTSTGSAGYGGTALPTSMFMSGIANTMTQMPMCTLIST